MSKIACTISGGYDSAAAYLKHPVNCDFVFFSYRQLYHKKEHSCAIDFAHFAHRNLNLYEVPGFTDMPCRNFMFLLILRINGYREVIMGSRNVLPWFDKYKDSNWLSLKLFAWLIGVKLHLPVTGWSKKRVIQYVESFYKGPLYNCYLNNDDYRTCECVNCKEMRKIRC